jgi:HrpA-like RNA helicase
MYYSLLSQRQLLPVFSFQSDVVRTVSSSPVTIIEGSTGSGKTTQIPQFLLDVLPPGGRLVCTQPRRVAAISVATRVAAEMDVSLGSIVGYCVRFDSQDGRTSHSGRWCEDS